MQAFPLDVPSFPSEHLTGPGICQFYGGREFISIFETKILSVWYVIVFFKKTLRSGFAVIIELTMGPRTRMVFD